MLAETIEEEIFNAINSVLVTNTKIKDDDMSHDKSENNDLESLVDSIVPRKKIRSIDSNKIIDYSRLEEEFHFEQIHYAAMENEYLPKAAAEHDSKYKGWEEETTVYLMEESATMDEVEAKDTIQEVMYSAVFGGSEVSLATKERLDNWIKTNHTLFTLYKSMASVRSDDVNYSVH